ncbi:MAG: type VII toxin-antitoxin system HepT family RNase toxin [Candidatus Thorarchaeota archaeon]
MAVDSNLIKRRLRRIQEELEHLKWIKQTLEEETEEPWRGIRLAERTIEIITQAIIDIASHIIAHKRWPKPTTRKETIITLSLNGVIEKELANRFTKLVGLINIIVHEYFDVDEKIVIRSVPMLIVDADTFVQQITASLPNL